MALKTNERYVDDIAIDAEPLSEDGCYVSEEEYWEKYYEHLDFNYEWNNGILEEKPVSDYKNIAMYGWFFMVLNHFLQTYKVAKTVYNDFGFRLALPEKVSIRKPDLAVVLTENREGLFDDDKSFKGIYDLCVELISDATRKAIKRDTEDKKNEYETIGVREYYILDASNKHMAFYRLNTIGFFEHIKLIDGDIIRSTVLKGFQFRISDLFRKPSMKELTEDQLYNHFIFPHYIKIKEEAETEKEMRAEAEKMAETEKEMRAEAEKMAEAEKEMRAEAEKMAETEKEMRAEAEKMAETEKKMRAEAEKMAETEKEMRAEAEKKADYLASKLRQLGISTD